MNWLDNAVRNPMFHLGAGLLGSPNFGQGLQQGLLGYQAQQAWQQQQEEREADKQRMLAQSRWMHQNMPEMMNAPAEVQKAAIGQMFAKPKVTDDMAEYQQAVQQGFKGTFMDYMRTVKPLSATRVSNVVNPLQKSVTGGLQTDVIAGQQGMSQIDELMGMLSQAPELVGAPQKWLEAGGGLARSFGGAFGSDFLVNMGDLISPTSEIRDAEGNVVRTITPTTIAAKSLAIKAQLRPLLAPDKGPLTQQEQATMKEAFGMLDSSDAKIRMEALRTISATLAPKIEKAKTYLRVSGAAVPGEQNYPRVTSKKQMDALESGAMFIAPDGSVRRKK